MGFQNQKFPVEAMDEGGFAEWLAQTRAQPSRLDEAAYQSLSRRSTLPAPLAFGAVEPDLFEHIVNQSQPSGHTLELQKLGPSTNSLPMESATHAH